LDLGISANVLEDVLLGVAAQRLLRKKTGSGGYRGRIAATEILKPDGSYVEGNIREYAESLVHSGITDLDEVNRVLA
jgi:type II secretory ATPase GspE/PulE/Tfp pilus assembly ATPase PilB-like protein